jgi:integrase
MNRVAAERDIQIFGLKWGDIDFERGTMSVIRSIVYGVVGPCKTESSQKPVPMHPTLADALMQWRNVVHTSSPRTGFLQVRTIGAEDLMGARRSCANTYATSRNSEAIWMAYVPARLLDHAAKPGD